MASDTIVFGYLYAIPDEFSSDWKPWPDMFTPKCALFSFCSHRSYWPVEFQALWVVFLSMRRAPLYQIWSRQIFHLDGWCQQDPSTSLPSCLESFGCHCHLQDDTRKVSAFGCKLIKNTTVFFFFKLSCRASIQPSLLPFEYSVGQGVHLVPVKLFSVPAKNPSPTLAFKG